MKGLRNIILGSLLLLGGAARAEEEEEDDGERVSLSSTDGEPEDDMTQTVFLYSTAHSDADACPISSIC